MNGIMALTFDTGGTVLDWHTGITRALGQAGQRHGLELDWPAIANGARLLFLHANAGIRRHAVD
jgi:2-haloacid dehalogenase